MSWQLVRLRRTTVEDPFGTIKYRIFVHPRLLLRGLAGAQTEIIIASMAYNFKRVVKILGATPSLRHSGTHPHE